MYFEIGKPYSMILLRSSTSSLGYGGVVSQWCGINGVEPNELSIGSRRRTCIGLILTFSLMNSCVEIIVQHWLTVQQNELVLLTLWAYTGEKGTSGTITQMVLVQKDYLFYENIGSIIARGIGLSMWSTGKQTGVLGLNLLLSSTVWSTMGSRIRFYYLLSKFYPMKI